MSGLSAPAALLPSLNQHCAALRLSQHIPSFAALCRPGVAAGLLYSTTAALLEGSRARADRAATEQSAHAHTASRTTG